MEPRYCGAFLWWLPSIINHPHSTSCELCKYSEQWCNNAAQYSKELCVTILRYDDLLHLSVNILCISVGHYPVYEGARKKS